MAKEQEEQEVNTEFVFTFNKENGGWREDTELNNYFVMTVFRYANHRLRSIGHIFLNEILDHFGFDRVFPDGQTQGWVLGKDAMVEIEWEQIRDTHDFQVTIKTQGHILEALT